MRLFWRIYCSCVAVWLSFWAVVGGFNAFRQYQLSNEFIAASKANDMSLAAAINQVSDMHAHWVSTSLMMTVFWTVPGMIAAAAGGGVFKVLSKAQSK